jgi:TM2 domain-containing membrane protein YozV
MITTLLVALMTSAQTPAPPVPVLAPAADPVAVPGTAPAVEQPIDEANVPTEITGGVATEEELKEAAFALRFADHLFADGDYYRAITEYRKYLFTTKGRGDQAPRAALAIGEALLRGEQLDAAGRQLDGVATRTLDLQLRHGALFAAGRAYLEDKRPELAKPRFRLVVEDDGAEPELREEARWLLAWGHFDAGEIDVAKTLFAAMGTGGRHAKDAAGMATALAGKDDLDLKNPMLAAVFSVIPGGGHIYLGQYGTGATAFIWNAVFIAATIHAFWQGDWGVGALLAFAELGWYSGSLFGAVSGAYRHNRDVVRNWRDQLVQEYGASRAIPEATTLSDVAPGTMLRFRGRF